MEADDPHAAVHDIDIDNRQGVKNDVRMTMRLQTPIYLILVLDWQQAARGELQGFHVCMKDACIQDTARLSSGPVSA
jgi:hypothetical protein